jgi:hypothetical protein
MKLTPPRALALTRERAIVLITLLSLVALTAVVSLVRLNQESSQLPLTSDSDQADGAHALALWLAALGYDVAPLEYQSFGVPPSADVLLVLSPVAPFDRAELEALDGWVQDGGTLVIALGLPSELPFGDVSMDVFSSGALLNHFDLGLTRMDEFTGTLALAQPLLVHPPVGLVATHLGWGLTVERPGAVVHAYQDDVPVLVSLNEGAGQVWVTTLAYAFTNRALHDGGSARLVLNLVAAAGPAHKVLFDEIHHGRVAEPETASDWLRRNPVGWAILYAAGVLFAYAVIQGRRFGRPLPAPHATVRRAPEEYILAMANLFRRGGLRDATARHYHERLKRTLARPYRLDPTQRDAAFVAELARYREGLDQDRLLRLLQALSRPGLSEAELLRLAGEVDRWGRDA